MTPHPRDPEIYPGDLDPQPEEPRVGEVWMLKGREKEVLVIDIDGDRVTIAPMGEGVQTITVAELQENFVYSGESAEDEVEGARENAEWEDYR